MTNKPTRVGLTGLTGLESGCSRGQPVIVFINVAMPTGHEGKELHVCRADGSS